MVKTGRRSWTVQSIDSKFAAIATRLSNVSLASLLVVYNDPGIRSFP